MKATAIAHPNIALVKYWGKRDVELNLPAVGSISLTLKQLHTISQVEFRQDLDADILVINDQPASPQQTQRVSRFLDLIRRQAGVQDAAEVVSSNNFPTGAGLASSASAFASLALAGSTAAGLKLVPGRLSELARLGSGSAARSIFGGFAEMKIGERSDGSDAVAVQLADENYWDICILVAVTSEREKQIGSTEGMTRTAKSSPFYGQWIFSSQQDLEEMRNIIFTRNFNRLGEIAENNCLKMHAVALSAKPGLIYWNAATIEVMHAVRQMREDGLPAYFTIDAGPQVKVICQAKDSEDIRSRLEAINGVKQVLFTSPGAGAEIVEQPI